MVSVVIALNNLAKIYFYILLLFAIATIFILSLFFSMPADAKMAILSDKKLSEVTATGFSKFTLTQGVTDIARIDLNLQAETYMDVGTIKMGYWDNGAALGWDQNWQSVSFGTDAQDLVLNDFVFEAEFQNVGDSATRQLQGITIGFTNVTGTISTDFGTFSGTIQGTDYDRAQLGQTTVTLNGEPFLLNLKASDGISFKIGY